MPARAWSSGTLRPLTWIILLLVSVAVRSNAGNPLSDPDKDRTEGDLLQNARRLIDTNHPEEAIKENIDKVLASFEGWYGKDKKQYYCARTPEESLLYLVTAADNNRAAVVLSPTWAAAYFMKAYALQNLGRKSEAITALDRALILSPHNSQYLSELGFLYAGEKNWSKALELFKSAEGDAALAPPVSKAFELSGARRGSGYVLVELGKLGEAEKKYEECLQADANDLKARKELDYVRALRSRAKSK